MPIIKIEFDNNKVSKNDIEKLSFGVQKIVSEVTGIEDVFVYGNSSEIQVKIAPIEIFIEMSAHKIVNQDELILNIKNRIIYWKQQNNFSQLINLTLIPMSWKIEIGI